MIAVSHALYHDLQQLDHNGGGVTHERFPGHWSEIRRGPRVQASSACTMAELPHMGAVLPACLPYVPPQSRRCQERSIVSRKTGFERPNVRTASPGPMRGRILRRLLVAAVAIVARRRRCCADRAERRRRWSRGKDAGARHGSISKDGGPSACPRSGQWRGSINERGVARGGSEVEGRNTTSPLCAQDAPSVCGMDKALGDRSDTPRAKRSQSIPTVLSRPEVEGLVAALHAPSA